MYKVLKRNNDKLSSPFQGYEYEPGQEYVCDDFDPNPHEDCSRGYYATGIDGLIYGKFRQKAHNFSRGMNGVFFQGTHYTVDICMVYML